MIVAVIVACEVGFWVVLAAGLLQQDDAVRNAEGAPHAGLLLSSLWLSLSGRDEDQRSRCGADGGNGCPCEPGVEAGRQRGGSVALLGESLGRSRCGDADQYGEPNGAPNLLGRVEYTGREAGPFWRDAAGRGDGGGDEGAAEPGGGDDEAGQDVEIAAVGGHSCLKQHSDGEQDAGRGQCPAQSDGAKQSGDETGDDDDDQGDGDQGESGEQRAVVPGAGRAKGSMTGR